MQKGNKQAHTPKGVAPVHIAGVGVTAPVVVTGVGTPAAKVVPGVLQVTPAKGALRGARAAWYAVLLQYNGKPVAEFLAACTANPPSLPKSLKAENPTGWLGWFKRQGIAAVVVPTATPAP